MGRLDAGAAPLPRLDWDAPWLESLRDLQPLLSGARAGAGRDWRSTLSAAARERGVVSGGQAALVFAGPDAAAGLPYETFIARTGQVPTRENLHDFFNALMWLAFPRAKAALNARQAEAIERLGVGPVRGPARDAATLIDESALLLACDDPEVEAALRAHDWQRLLVGWRPRWGRDIRALVFGHALLEKLAGPFKAITACVVPLPAAADLDTSLAGFVARPDLAPRLLPHLPVLGIPGWCAENADPRFYDDARVFRAKKAATLQGEKAGSATD